ncbi:MAG: hypothetical protein HZB35_11770 [Nitrospirae bacterium]|nr:hypothetical protein [Nitrospirota bacterium]
MAAVRRFHPMPTALLLLLVLLATSSVMAGPMTQDPQGFHGLLWGTALSHSPDFVLADAASRIKGYEIEDRVPRLGDTPVDLLRFVELEGRFARVTVRYHGKDTHAKVMAYLQQEFGPIDRSPGAYTRGAGQQFNWRGSETDVNLTYDATRERGFVFIDSRLLAPRFNDMITDSSE